MKKRLLAVFAVILGMTGCQSDVETVQSDTEQTTQETQQTTQETQQTTTEEQTESTFEDVEASETEASSESLDNAAETITIAGQEISVDETSVSILITDDSEPVTDISELSKLKNLKSILVNYITEGGYNRRIDGLKALEGSETIEEIDILTGFVDEEDIHIFKTMPNLKSLSLYRVYDDFEFNIPSLKSLYLLGTYDLSRIEHLTGLESLTLEYNNGDDLSPISKLKNLKSLGIIECFFEDYSSILELENLDSLWISSEPMTREMYDKICEKFPDCKITIINSFID